MTTRRSICAALGLALVAMALTWTMAQPRYISGDALDMDLNRKPMAYLRRQGPDLQVELRYFPSFESTFYEPEVSRAANGNTLVRLRSYSAGPFHRQSEQLTNMSFTVPSQSIEPGATIEFFSGDYDRILVVAKAP